MGANKPIEDIEATLLAATKSPTPRPGVPTEEILQQRLRATTLALAKALCETRDILSRIVATTLAIETVNGMAKTAMTDAAMASITEKEKRKVAE
jgi:hypothetical protein